MPNDANLIATVHNYSPFHFTHQGAEWVSPVLPVGVTCCSASQEAEMTAPLDVAKAWSAAKRYPVFVGEFGAYSKADDASRIDFNRKMRQAIEGRVMSWTYWEFAAGFGVYDPVKLASVRGYLTPCLALRRARSVFADGDAHTAGGGSALIFLATWQRLLRPPGWRCATSGRRAGETLPLVLQI